MAEAKQGLVELAAFSFVPVLEGLMRMIESLQEVRTAVTRGTHAHRPPAHLEHVPRGPMAVLVAHVINERPVIAGTWGVAGV